MECYVSINFTPLENHKKALTGFLKEANDDNKEEALAHLASITQDAANAYQCLISNEFYGDYATDFEEVIIERECLSLSTVTGSMGLEFAAAFMQFIAPYCEALDGEFHHDEEPEEFETWPMKLTYRTQSVFANEYKVDIRESADDFVFDLNDDWDQLPLVNQSDMAAIQKVCESISSLDLSKLSAAYCSLFSPITLLGQKYGDELEESLPDEGWLKEIMCLPSVEAAKNNHPAMALLANKMLADLEMMKTSLYFGSVLSSYKEILTICNLIIELHKPESDTSFADMFDAVESQEEFDALCVMLDLHGLEDE